MKKFIVGTTSFIFPTTVGENCKKLEKLVDEISIVMFETNSCLKYNEHHLPPWLKNLDLSYNIHLPLDLPWDMGPDKVFTIIKRLINKTDFLSPTSYVLHPPPQKFLFSSLIKLICKENIPLNKFSIENIKENNLIDIWEIILSTPLNICLDFGHLIEYNQNTILDLEKIFSKTNILHIYAPKKERHCSLAKLGEREISLLKHILKNIQPQATVILEVFNYKDLISSLDFFNSLWWEI